MERRMSLFIVCILLLCLLSACGNALKVETNTVYIQKKGNITGVTQETFDKDYYDKDELESYVRERVENYVEGRDSKSVKVDNFAIEEGIANLKISYAGYEDYARFNGVEMFAGTVPQALAAGYPFDAEFTAVSNGELGEPASMDDITADSDLKVVILSEKLNVKVDGTITHVSSDYTSMLAKDTVEIKLPEDARDGEELVLAYVVYKQK